MSLMPERLPDEQEAALRVAETRATKGPWHAHFHLVCDHENEAYARSIAECFPFGSGEEQFANADFIAAARQGVPALLAELAEVRAHNERITKAIHAIAYAAIGHGSFELTLTNVLRATKRAMNVIDGLADAEGQS